jgi:GT2 family glycosyltransferase
MVNQRNGHMPKDGGGNIHTVHIPDGGGNAISDQSVIVRRSAALGDCLAATCVTDKLIEQGYSVTFQAHPGVHCLLRRLRNKVAITDTNGDFVHVNLDNAYENDPQRRMKHFSQMFLDKANDQLRARNIHLGLPYNCKPHMSVTQQEKASALNRFKDFPRPWVFICPRSNTYNVRQVSDGTWQQAASLIQGTKFWLGNHGPAPAGIVDLGVRHLDNLIVWLSVADLLVSVDTGPMHIAAAMGIPVVVVFQSSNPDLHLNDQNDFIAVAPRLNCLGCMQHICPIHQHIPPCQAIEPDLIAQWANARLRSKFGNDVSAVVAVYKPEASMLNRCLESILPQVSEIIVVKDAFGTFPEGALQNPKIRYVVKGISDIGYGRKVMYGTRFTNGKWILHCNDDAYLEPDCVSKLLSVTKLDTGIVTPLLRYPEDRTIYHAGKVRSFGARGWGHIDHHKHLPTFTDITELENTCGCVILIRRQAFYDIDGFDENYYCYAEDDHMSLAIRQAGYKILFHPGALGWHSEHASTKKTPDIIQVMNRSNAYFGKRWGWYFDLNANTIPGKFR